MAEPADIDPGHGENLVDIGDARRGLDQRAVVLPHETGGLVEPARQVRLRLLADAAGHEHERRRERHHRHHSGRREDARA